MREISDAEQVHDNFNPDNKFVTPGPAAPMSIKDAMAGGNRLCVFCRKEFSGKPKSCPHCRKTFPVMPDALHIV